MTPSPNTKHQAVVGNLYALLWTHLKQHPIGSVFVGPFDVLFSDTDVVEPDILYISRERLEILTDQHVRGAPDLVVEVTELAAEHREVLTTTLLSGWSALLTEIFASPR